NGCRVAGTLTIFGNVLSVYTLAVITTERWYTITWAIHLNKRLKLRTAVRVMIAGWICALVMAGLPLIGVSSYSKTSICLPLENKGKADTIYLSTLLAFNAIAFALICVCYGSMYKSIREGGHTGSTTSVRSDLTVAKRMALLVFTDFACWAPIAFFSLTALLGHPLITVTQTKILLVFFYPLNSCANPCLYALLTQQYRRDFFILMGRYGLCKDRAERHKGAIGGKPLPYGSGPQYKRTSGEGTMKINSAGGNNHRGSLLTTIVSVEVPMVRTSSRNSARSRPESLTAVPEYSLQQINLAMMDDCRKLNSTENL
ncbi:7tm 1 domain containing protein, partial [Asbolus verrucosus]